MTKTINFEGYEVEYDDSAVHSWSVQRGLTDPSRQFDAFDRILCGKADDVAERLGDSVERMTDLLQRIATIEGNTAKN